MTAEQLAQVQAIIPNVDPLQLEIFMLAAVHAAKKAISIHGEAPIRAALETREGMEGLMRSTKSLIGFWQENLSEGK